MDGLLLAYLTPIGHIERLVAKISSPVLPCGQPLWSFAETEEI